MLFKKKTLDEKMEKYVKHHDWYAIQEVITGSKEEKIAAAKALGASDDQTSVDLLLRFIDDTDVVDYPLGYFFSGDSDDERYILKVLEEQTYRQLSAQYPTQEVMDRSAIMQYFDAEETTRINQMWINVRCYNIKNVPVWVWVLAGIIVVALIALSVKLKINKKYD